MNKVARKEDAVKLLEEARKQLEKQFPNHDFTWSPFRESAGYFYHTALCPFHPERVGRKDTSPSFTLSLRKGTGENKVRFKCFGCQISGHIEADKLSISDRNGDVEPEVPQTHREEKKYSKDDCFKYLRERLGEDAADFLLEGVLSIEERDGSAYIAFRYHDPTTGLSRWKFRPPREKRFFFSDNSNDGGNIVFFARRPLEPSQTALVLVEGEFDALQIARAVRDPSIVPVAAGGASALPQVGRMLAEIFPIIILAPDRDRAGFEALKEALRRIRFADVFVLRYESLNPHAKDPDEAFKDVSLSRENFLRLCESRAHFLQNAQIERLTIRAEAEKAFPELYLHRRDAFLDADNIEKSTPLLEVPFHIPRRSAALLAGFGEVGKTTLALYVCLLAGLQGLKAAFISFEEPRVDLLERLSWLKARLPEQDRAFLLERSKAETWFVIEDDETLDIPGMRFFRHERITPEAQKLLSYVTALAHEGFSLIFVDHLSALGVDANNNLDVTETFKHFYHIAKKTGATIFILHHMNKALLSEIAKEALDFDNKELIASAISGVMNIQNTTRFVVALLKAHLGLPPSIRKLKSHAVEACRDWVAAVCVKANRQSKFDTVYLNLFRKDEELTYQTAKPQCIQDALSETGKSVKGGDKNAKV
ncbi:AAA family ATPase [Thermosulfurimonas sp. F29]|uniref:AAA family ATPase n=1 Tax=Thermosulfurimonas sp. F29 TaxID=2867247 RepID=UPI001C82EFE7|nr:AAA family ATPase [Thermosulfurimonas sp. F29]MBX6423796.1 AAA family ATPase [Thermosulfurimonas sp. F29]